MGNKQRKPNRKNSRGPSGSKQTPTRAPGNDVPQVKPDTRPTGDRFVLVNEIAERFGVGPTAVRQWARQGKFPLRKLFGTSGMYGMPESQLERFIRGENV